MRDSGNNFPSNKSTISCGTFFAFRLGVPRMQSYPSMTINSFGPKAVNEFHADEKPPKPFANGLFAPFARTSYKKIIDFYKVLLFLVRK